MFFRNLKFLFVIVLVLVSVFCVALMYPNSVFRPFEDFKGPDYVPAGFNNTENFTNDNERIFEYDGEGSFYVGVIKNTTFDAELEYFLNPFQDDPSNVVKYGEDININGHTVRFNVSEMDFNMDPQGLEKIKQNLPENISSKINLSNTTIPAVNIQMAKFQAIWTCNKTGLTYFAVGLVTHDKMEEMKKMATSIHCHPPKSYLERILGK